MNAPELAQIRGQHSDHRRDERDICMERCTMPRREDKEGVRAGGKCPAEGREGRERPANRRPVIKGDI